MADKYSPQKGDRVKLTIEATVVESDDYKAKKGCLSYVLLEADTPEYLDPVYLELVGVLEKSCTLEKIEKPLEEGWVVVKSLSSQQKNETAVYHKDGYLYLDSGCTIFWNKLAGVEVITRLESAK